MLCALVSSISSHSDLMLFCISADQEDSLLAIVFCTSFTVAVIADKFFSDASSFA